MSFAKEFSSQRKRLNLSQGDIGKSIGVSRAYITLIENGKRRLGKKHLLKIAQALDVKKHIIINWYLQDLRERLT